jgi:hypothetical protein
VARSPSAADEDGRERTLLAADRRVSASGAATSRIMLK